MSGPIRRSASRDAPLSSVALDPDRHPGQMMPPSPSGRVIFVVEVSGIRTLPQPSLVVSVAICVVPI
jgi:hypothetical protein